MICTDLEMLHALKEKIALRDGPRNGQCLQFDGGIVGLCWCQ